MNSSQLHIDALKRAIKEKAGRSMDSPGDYDFLSSEVMMARQLRLAAPSPRLPTYGPCWA